MSLPQIPEYKVPLLLEVERAGGVARASDIYDRVLSHFPPGFISASDLNERQGSGRPGRYKNLIQNARELLKQSKDIEASQGGVWPITAQGKETLRQLLVQEHHASPTDVDRVISSDLKLHQIDPSWKPKATGPARTAARQPGALRQTVAPAPQPPAPGRPGTNSPPLAAPSPPSATAGAEEALLNRPTTTGTPEAETLPAAIETARPKPAETAVPIEAEIISRMTDMSPRQFEEFVGKLFRGLGYTDVEVVGRSGDGGVDLMCKFEVPLIGSSVTLVCQVKRRKDNVGPSDVGDLRGRWAHRADRLILINTGGFTYGAREEAPAEAGRKEVTLVTGSELARLMADNGLGVAKRPLIELSLDERFWEEFSP